MTKMPPFLRAIAAGLAATCIGSIVALVSCAHPAIEESEFHNLEQIAAKAAQHVRPVVDGLVNLAK
jgi:hypothetical protein